MGIDFKHMRGDDYLKLAALAVGSYFGGPMIASALGGGAAAGAGAGAAAGWIPAEAGAGYLAGAATDAVAPTLAGGMVGSDWATGMLGDAVGSDWASGVPGAMASNTGPDIWSRIGDVGGKYMKGRAALQSAGLLGEHQQPQSTPMQIGPGIPGAVQIVPPEQPPSAIPFVPDALDAERRRRLAMFYGQPYQG